MARKRKGRALDGVLLLDKPEGMSSNQAVQRVRWLFNAQKVGHGGTLDPFATGLLPILFGDATKFGRYMLDADKAYEVTLSFGRETDTDDHTGATIREAPLPVPSEADWQRVIAQFSGEHMQVPPIYSALKIGGERAYRLARKGQLPDMLARTIRIDAITVLDHRHGEARLAVRCSKGTYIRALVRDIGRALGSAAHAKALRRTAVGRLASGLYSLEQLSDQAQEELDKLLLPLDECVADLAKIDIPEDKLRYFIHGNDIELLGDDYGEGEYAFYYRQQLLGIGKVAQGRAYPQRLCASAVHIKDE